MGIGSFLVTNRMRTRTQGTERQGFCFLVPFQKTLGALFLTHKLPSKQRYNFSAWESRSIQAGPCYLGTSSCPGHHEPPCAPSRGPLHTFLNPSHPSLLWSTSCSCWLLPEALRPPLLHFLRGVVTYSLFCPQRRAEGQIQTNPIVS